MKRILISLVSVCTLLTVTPVHGATFESKDIFSLSVPVSDDLYVSGGSVTIDQNVNGDLFVGAGKVNVTGTVKSDVTIGGGTVTVSGMVGDDVRIAGGDITVHGRIGSDVIVMGGTVTIEKDATIVGDLVAMGGHIVVHGTVGKNIKINGGTIVMDGIAHGDMEIRGEKVDVSGPVQGDAILIADSLTLGKNASFLGKVEYWTAKGVMDFGKTMPKGQTATYHSEYRTQISHKQAAGITLAFLGALSLFSLLSQGLIILLLTLITKTFFIDTAKILKKKMGLSFLVGLGYMVGVPILTALLFLSIIGIPLGFVSMAMYGFVLFFSTSFTSLVLARYIELRHKQTWGKAGYFGVTMGIFVILKLLNIIPIIGWLVKGILVLMALGALIQVKYVKLKKIL